MLCPQCNGMSALGVSGWYCSKCGCEMDREGNALTETKKQKSYWFGITMLLMAGVGPSLLLERLQPGTIGYVLTVSISSLLALLGLFSIFSTLESRKGTKKNGAIILALPPFSMFGLHRFYLGSWGWGIIFVIALCINAVLIEKFNIVSTIGIIVGLIEATRYLFLPKDEFNEKVNKLTGPFSFLW